MYKIRQKLSNSRDRKERPFTQRKITLIFTTVKSFFSETRIGFRHWVTRIIKPNDRNMLRHDLHDNRRIDKIRKICFMQNNHNSRRTSKAIFEKKNYGSRYFRINH